MILYTLATYLVLITVITATYMGYFLVYVFLLLLRLGLIRL
jgi:hypothetical protein